MSNHDIKQVIVIRKDLGMRRGKEIAQGSHASMAFIAEIFTTDTWFEHGETPAGILDDDDAIAWLNDGFKKVCLQVDTEEELLALEAAARAAGVRNVHLIVDEGVTEFDNVPTATCLAIGPAHSDKIDPITGNLRLY